MINLTITSPPFYDDELYLLEKDTREFGWLTYEDYLKHLFSVVSEIYRITAPGGKLVVALSNSPKIDDSSIIQSYWPCLHDLIAYSTKIGWKLVDEIAWIHRKPVYEVFSGSAPNIRTTPFHNWISVLEKPRQEGFSAGTSSKVSSVWEITSEGPIKEYNESYGSFPDELVENCLKYWSMQGDLILDPYAGSGQTVRVALKHGRKAIGFEVDIKWEHLWSDINNSL